MQKIHIPDVMLQIVLGPVQSALEQHVQLQVGTHALLMHVTDVHGPSR
jgi:hypothetical protein